ncbi:SRPBCC domain-containing protein [Paucibacter sp. PLA-PC-4]|uniref:SRPBCC domain-containing protein n=1 Tax=Paucibacter sp. PLA-PC-4 TaxID=2993655 RepID=UPI002248E014|nr:SRPBCC domain-containing protein [Paucibacter sp. PLA-PC-4]MCX2861033.1 SRPBCC domain-containing protein [Paucibacter sp. PLA-PC-4]
MKITVSTVVAAPITDVWRAYNSPDDIKIWNTASSDWHTTSSSVDLRVGGKFSSRMEAKDGSFGFDFEGEYTKVAPQALIEYSFGGRVGLVEFSEDAAGVTVTVTFDSEESHSEEAQRTGWQAILDNFARHVSTLKDQPQPSAA